MAVELGSRSEEETVIDREGNDYGTNNFYLPRRNPCGNPIFDLRSIPWINNSVPIGLQ
jgi:hypothetical protein